MQKLDKNIKKKTKIQTCKSSLFIQEMAIGGGDNRSLALNFRVGGETGEME